MFWIYGNLLHGEEVQVCAIHKIALSSQVLSSAIFSVEL
jgi:hypothetical protein